MSSCAATICHDRLGILAREAAVAMTGGGVREVFETILPECDLMSAVRAAGLQERERKLIALLLLRSMITAASTRYCGRQADAMKLYFESGEERGPGGTPQPRARPRLASQPGHPRQKRQLEGDAE
jgi:hypothetical protein